MRATLDYDVDLGSAHRHVVVHGPGDMMFLHKAMISEAKRMISLHRIMMFLHKKPHLTGIHIILPDVCKLQI